MPIDLPRTARVTARRRFDEIFALRCSAADARLVVYAAPNGGRRSRIGLVVGKRHGGAVERNRIKRLLREAFRLAQDELPKSSDFVVVPRVGAPADLAKYRASLAALARRAAGRIHTRPSAPD